MAYLTFKFHSNKELISADETRLDHTPDCTGSPEIRFSQTSIEEIDFCLLSKDLVCMQIGYFYNSFNVIKIFLTTRSTVGVINNGQ